MSETAPETTTADMSADEVVETDRFYCPGCGARYPVGGQCDNEHPPMTLETLEPSAQDPPAELPPVAADTSRTPAGTVPPVATASPPNIVTDPAPAAPVAAEPNPLQKAAAAIESAMRALADASAALASKLDG